MKKLDAKFTGVIVKNKDGSIVPQDEYVVFLAKDNAFPATVEFYINECRRQGAEPEQVDAVREMYDRLTEWREANPDRCKPPDVEPGELLV